MNGTWLRTAAAAMGVAAIAAAAFGGVSAGATEAAGVVAVVKDTAGNDVGRVTMVEVEDQKVKVTARLQGLAPGFHGFHVHSVGVCDPGATDASGSPSPFLTASGHFNPQGATHSSHAGDMPPLLVTGDGRALLRFESDRFSLADLRDANGSAVIVHAGPDNLGHVPARTPAGADRYHSHSEPDPSYTGGPDAATRATGDAGARFACGALIAGS